MPMAFGRLGHFLFPNRLLVNTYRIIDSSVKNHIYQRNILLQTRSYQTTEMDTLFGESFPDVDIINMVQGAPGVHHLQQAGQVIQKATQHLFSRDIVKENGYSLQYGPRLGSQYARDNIANFLSEGYGDKVDGDSIVITGGATNGLQLACTQFFKSGDVVFVEDPTYFIATHILRKDMDMTVVPVPTDEEGMDLDVYEKLLEKHCKTGDVSDEHPFRAMCYIIPTYHNPKGWILSPERSKKLVELARKYEVLNFCDDVYNLLHFDVNTRAPARVLTYDNPSDADYKGHTVSNGTVSKILSPGMRVGWWETSPRIVQLVKKSNILWGAGCTNHYGSEVIGAAMELGLQQAHLKQMNIEYQKKVQAVYDTMQANFPDCVKVKHLKGGYFFWIELPETWKGADVAKIALEKYKARVMPGSACSAVGNFTNTIRMSIAYQDTDNMVEGAKRLAQALKDYQASL